MDSESDDLEVLEAEVETARAKREEREALERLAKARRARGSNAFARSVRLPRSVRSAISSERFGAQQVSNTQTSQSAPRNPPALPAPPAPPAPMAPEHQPALPTAQSSWLEWFATHAPRRNGPLSCEEIQMLADVGVPQNSEFPAFVNSCVIVRNRAAELERAQTVSEHGSDQGKGFQRFLDERDGELQSACARVQEVGSMIMRQGSRTSFESVVSRDSQTPPGLPAAMLHSRPMNIAGPWHEWHETSVHDPQWNEHAQPEHAHVSHTPPPPAPPPGGDDDSSSSSSSESDAEARKRKKKKRGPYKVKNAEMRLPQYQNALTFQS